MLTYILEFGTPDNDESKADEMLQIKKLQRNQEIHINDQSVICIFDKFKVGCQQVY